MKRNSNTIRSRINALESQLMQERAALEDALRRERLDAKGLRVYERMHAGDYPVVTANGLRWCNDGQLLDRLDSDEITGLSVLEQQGIAVMETRRSA